MSDGFTALLWGRDGGGHRLHPTHHLLLMVLVSYDVSDAKGGAWPAIETLTGYLDCSRDTVDQACRALEAHGLIVREKRDDGQTTFYAWRFDGPEPAVCAACAERMAKRARRRPPRTRVSDTSDMSDRSDRVRPTGYGTSDRSDNPSSEVSDTNVNGELSAELTTPATSTSSRTQHRVQHPAVDATCSGPSRALAEARATAGAHTSAVDQQPLWPA